MSTMMFCQACGTEMAKTARACPQCGARPPRSGSGLVVLWVVLGLAAVPVAVAILGILAAIALPAYQDSTVRNRTTAAFIYAKQASVSVTEYYMLNDKTPSTLAETGFTTKPPPGIGAIDLDPESALLTVHFLEPDSLRNKTLQLIPTFDEKGGTSWQCHSDSIADNKLPSDCR